jgi:putative N6-adenine-specific DNA methylase
MVSHGSESTQRHPWLRDQLRLVGVAGANRIMAGELSRLTRRAHDDVRVPIPLKEGPGAISYPFDVKLAATAAQFHRTSARVLWELYRCPATRLEELYQNLLHVLALDEREWYWGGATLSVRAYALQGMPAGERQVVGTVKNAIIEAAGRRGLSMTVDAANPDLSIDLRMVGEQLSVALDLAGQPMHQRGYRTTAGPAPLREDLAALLVMLARHDSRSEVLLEPMAGSGTIGIEAALLGTGRATWCMGREPLCRRWPRFAGLILSGSPTLFHGTEPLVVMNETDPDLIGSARANARNAGAESAIEFVQGDFRSLTLQAVNAVAARRGRSAERGVILCNPPYGERLSDKDSVLPLYRALGAWCRGFVGWRAAFLVSHVGFEAEFGGRPRIKKPLKNGPLDAMFYMYDL